MREIDLNTRPSRTTVLSYGTLRSGKTRWAATWPRPLFLSEASESGWTTLSNMADSAFHEPGRRPKVWAIEKAADLLASIPKAEALIESGEIATIVIDSVTFYADLYYSQLVAMARQAGRQPDLRQIYGNLGDHLRFVREQFHALPCNVIWLALEKAPDADTPQGGPLIPGQSAKKFAAGVDYILYHRVFSKSSAEGNTYEIRTTMFDRYVAGGRDEGKLPNPLGFIEETENGDVFVPDCTYQTFAEALDLAKPDFAPKTITRPTVQDPAPLPVVATPSAKPAKPSSFTVTRPRQS